MEVTYLKLSDLEVGKEYTILELSHIYDVSFRLSNFKPHEDYIGSGILVSINNNPPMTFEEEQEANLFIFKNHREQLCNLVI